MGSLSSLYISQSYQSLAHLGTDNALSIGTMTLLQDGIGQSLNISFDGTNISSSGNIYGANITGSQINTGSLVTTSSFNSYTSSTNARLSSIETTTASLNNSVSALNTNSASVNSSISNLNTATASFSSSINQLNASSASQQISINALNTNSASVNSSITQLNASSASQQSSINAINAVSNSWVTESETGSFVKNISATANPLEFFYDLGNGGTNTVTLVSPTGSAIDTGSFATTGSNSFNGDQTITGSVIVNYDTPSSPQLVIDKNTYEVTLRKIQGTQPMLIENAGTSNLQISTTIFDDSYKVLVNNNEFYYDGGTSLNQLQKTQINGKLIVTNTLTASLQEGYAWVGGVGNVSKLVATSSFGTTINTGSFVTTSSFNSYTSSTNNRLNNLETTSASVNISISNLNTTTASLNNSVSLLNSFTQSQTSINTNVANSASLYNTKWNTLGGQTGSYVTSAITASSLVTASVNLNTITFTKGDATTFNINVNTGSATDISSLNQFTASQLNINSGYNTFTSSTNTSINALNQFTASQSTASLVNSITELNTFSASAKISISALNSATSSYVTETESGSFLITASFDNGNRNLTFTKGDNTTFAVNIPDVSGSAGTFVTTSSFNAYTQSNDQRVSSLESNSASVNISISNINQTTASLNSSVTQLNASSASQQVSIDSLNAATSSYANSASVALVDANQQSQINSLIAATGSYLTASADITSLNAFTASQLNINTGYNTFTSSQLTINSAIGASTASLNTFSSSVLTQLSTLENVTSSLISKTGSYATTGSNNFIGDQTITGNLTAFSASFTYLQTIYESSSIIYSSGSNQFGDELTDVQTLSGSVKVQGSLTINGTPVLTSSVDISGLVTTASFNAYTSSNNQRVDSLESNSASVNISISNINSTTASLNSSVTNINSFTQSANQRIGSLEAATSSYVTSAITASSLVTASVNLNTITFTKGDASTFNIVVNTGSAVTTDITALNSFTASQETKNSTLASVTSSLNSATASLFTSASLSLVTASFSGNTLTFTKGDTSTFGVVIPDISGSTIDTGSFMTTGSVNVNVLTFTKGDGSTFDLTVSASGSAPAGTVSSSAQILNYNIFATTGSNSFNGGQNISSSINVGDYLGTDRVFISQNGIQLENAIQTNINFNAANNFFSAGGNFFLGNTLGGVGSGSITMTANNGGNVSVSGSQTNIAGIDFIPFSASVNSRILAVTGSSINTGSLLVTASFASNNITFTKGDASTFNLQGFATTGSNNFKGVETIGDIAGTATGEVYLLGRSGSLIIGNSVNSPTYAALSHLSSSAVNGNTNLIFKNTTFTGDTIISGSGNIFSNPFTPTTGYKRYIGGSSTGGSNNLYLNSTNGINSQITASAASVSGTRPTMVNNIFNGDTDFLINQAVNSVGTHTYSHNRIGGTNATVTINALSHTGSVNILTNTVSNGVITINASSASLAEIATGRSGSGTVNVNSNLIQGGTVTNTSPLALGTSLTQTILSNIVTGGSITVTNISSSANVNAFNNIAIGAMSYTNAGAAGLALHRTAGSFSTCYGAMTFVASGSAITATNNISPAAMVVTNRMFSGSLGSGSLAFNNNQTQGGGNTYTITGSFGGTGNPAMQANGVFGATNTIFTNVEGRGNYTSVSNNLIGGGNLILTGSNNLVLTEGGGAHFGRYNANDGRRNTTGENILSVGTGTSTARKTGFLIDSGSNSFFEGTLNVSGSTSLTGSLTIQSGSAFFANGNKQFNVGAFQSGVTQSGSANVSQSMNFETTDISSGISIASNSRITLANSGTYNIQFSAQLNADTGADTIWIWLKKNGTNVSSTTTKLVLANNEANVAAWNFVVDSAASDYFELAWQNTNGHAKLLAEAAAGNYPAIPSIILTVTQVR